MIQVVVLKNIKQFICYKYFAIYAIQERKMHAVPSNAHFSPKIQTIHRNK